MRMSTALINQMKNSGITDNQSSFNTQNERMNAKKNFLSPADSPMSHREIMRLKQAQALRDQFTVMRSSAKETMTFQGTVMDEISSLVKHINETMVSSMNQVGVDDKQRQVYAEDLKNSKERLLSLVNKQDNSGNYIFSGDKSDVKPYELDSNGKLVYKGGDAKLQQIDQFTSIKVNTTGKEALGISATSDVFSALNKAIAALNTPIDDADQTARDAQRDALVDVKKDIETLNNNLGHAMAKNGLQIKEVESLNERDKELTNATEDQIMDIQFLDPAIGGRELLDIKLALLYSYQSFALMKDMSILNYVK